MKQRLAAVLAADMAGYSRLMEADEAGTLARLRTHRIELIDPAIAKNEGRIIKTTGDGMLVEFQSVTDAVKCAVEVQQRMRRRNADVAQDRRIEFRIGINLGDVIEVGDDIYGDGVNIAARLQSSAPPGGIVISSTVYDQVRNKVPVGFDFLGQLEVKNVAEGVPSYAVRIGEAAPASKAERPHEAYRQRTPPAAAPAPPEPSLFEPGSTAVYRALAAAAILVAVINLMTSRDSFWSKWPIATFALIAGLQWARTQTRFDRRTMALIVLGLGLVMINVLTGGVWAQWPLLAIAILIVIRWLGIRR